MGMQGNGVFFNYMPINNSNRVRYKNNFHKLAIKLERIVNTFHKDILIICNSNIHLSRNHPDLLNLWKPYVFNEKVTFNDIFTVIIKVVKSIFSFFLSTFLELLKLAPGKIGSYSIPVQPEYFFISHLIKEENTQNDFYYGSLIEDLVRLNIEVVRFVVPYEKISLKSRQKETFKTFLLNSNLRKKEVILYFFMNIFSFFKLIFYCLRHKFSLYESSVILTGQLMNFSLVKIVLNLERAIKLFPPKNLVMTFEGNALERAVFFLCKLNGVKSYGYQHAPIIESQNSIFRILKVGLNPDHILCSGPFAATLFNSKLKSNIPITILGHPKNNHYKEFRLKKLNNNLLLVPDGNAKSVDSLFALGLDLSSLNSEIKVSIRSHPLQSNYLNDKFINLLGKIPNNFRISDSDLNVDLDTNYWVVYRNSSTCLEAIFAGCEVIHYSHPNSNIDPLWGAAKLHQVASGPTSVLRIVTSPKKRSHKQAHLLLAFAMNYFSPLKPQALINIKSMDI